VVERASPLCGLWGWGRVKKMYMPSTCNWACVYTCYRGTCRPKARGPSRAFHKKPPKQKRGVPHVCACAPHSAQRTAPLLLQMHGLCSLLAADIPHPKFKKSKTNPTHNSPSDAAQAAFRCQALPTEPTANTERTCKGVPKSTPRPFLTYLPAYLPPTSPPTEAFP
jgi:hypothetical protein